VGDLLDTASPRLGGLRAAVRVAYDRLRRRLDSLVGAELGSALQEPIVTLRNGRYVVPVKAEARSRVKGIVHDASGSGQTLFIEPLVAVELGNAWREAQVAEHEEIARILDELSALVGANAAGLRETLDALARFDFWAAKAQLAGDMSAVRAETTDRAEHRRQDRHAANAGAARVDAPGRAPHPGRRRQPPAGPARRVRRHRRRTVDRPVALDLLRAPALDRADRGRGRPGHARPARRARRRHGPDRGLGAGAGAARSLHRR